MKCITVLALTLSLLATVIPGPARASVTSPSEVRRIKAFQEIGVAGYVCRTWGDPDFASGPGGFKILRDGKVVYYRETSGSTRFTSVPIEYTEDRPLEVRDITGDGVPDLVVWVACGNRFAEYYVVSLGDRPKELLVCEEASPDWRQFEDLDGDGVFEMIVYDGSYGMRWTSAWEAPAPSLVYGFTGDAYRFDPARTRRPPPSEGQFSRELREVLQRITADPGSYHRHFLAYVFDLIYCGNGPLAWDAIDVLWGSEETRQFGERALTKAEFIRDVRAALKESPYWEHVMEVNGWKPEGR